ncbi:hypothetical protein SAMN05428957_102160 [Oryzisolibacter propanilivorax]|uniref:DUF2946 domain-containing protein n=1 Tax=Oryzisolibacter propanilivorax TaxID=1527607 RepID=A0A1G9QBJ9_9BURK|nr:hypothetical protein [Oryzisolibacter propanilivorax]SDM07745.1 hypothetical protein SAMN05428957_102160 [Oryzisolibacter propanilivorax]
MLQRLRQHRPLRTLVPGLVALAWLVALLAGVPTRQAVQPLADSSTAALHEVCLGAVPGADAPAAAPDHSAGHQHHADPGCVLCLALGDAPGLALAPQRPPAPDTQRPAQGRSAAHTAWRALAPLPARGPPLRA